jgi:hypothetical protein
MNRLESKPHLVYYVKHGSYEFLSPMELEPAEEEIVTVTSSSTSTSVMEAFDLLTFGPCPNKEEMTYSVAVDKSL